jgi:long-subunit fatty acid transport protein
MRTSLAVLLASLLVSPVAQAQDACLTGPSTLADQRAFAALAEIALGNIDSVVNNPAARQAFAASAPPKLLVEVEHSGHYTFSDGCFPRPDCNPPITLTQPEAHAAALRYIVPFLEQYLAGRDASPLLGPPTGPGFVYQAEF